MSYDETAAGVLRELGELRRTLAEAEPKACDEHGVARADIATIDMLRQVVKTRDAYRDRWGECHERHVIAEGYNTALRARLQHAVLLPPDAAEQLIEAIARGAHADQPLTAAVDNTVALLNSWRPQDPDSAAPRCAVDDGQQPPPVGVMTRTTMLPRLVGDVPYRTYRACPSDESWTLIEWVRDGTMGNRYHLDRVETYIVVWGGGLYLWSDVDRPDAPVHARQLVAGDFITVPPRRAFAFRLDPGTQLVAHHDGPEYAGSGDAAAVEHVLYPIPDGFRQLPVRGGSVMWERVPPGEQ